MNLSSADTEMIGESVLQILPPELVQSVNPTYPWDHKSREPCDELYFVFEGHTK